MEAYTAKSCLKDNFYIPTNDGVSVGRFIPLKFFFVRLAYEIDFQLFLFIFFSFFCKWKFKLKLNKLSDAEVEVCGKIQKLFF